MDRKEKCYGVDRRSAGKMTNRGESNMRTKLTSRLSLLFLTFAMVLALPAIALADNFQNTLASSETGTRTITTDGTTAGSTTVGYRVVANSSAGDTQASCNVTDGSPLN